jgi:hypothetical protein
MGGRVNGQMSDPAKLLEKRYMTKERSLIYIACEELDFVWDEHDLIRFIAEWQNGTSIFELENIFKRSQNEIAILILDLGSKGAISERSGGIFGS